MFWVCFGYVSMGSWSNLYTSTLPRRAAINQHLVDRRIPRSILSRTPRGSDSEGNGPMMSDFRSKIKIRVARIFRDDFWWVERFAEREFNNFHVFFWFQMILIDWTMSSYIQSFIKDFFVATRFVQFLDDQTIVKGRPEHDDVVVVAIVVVVCCCCCNHYIYIM